MRVSGWYTRSVARARLDDRESRASNTRPNPPPVPVAALPAREPDPLQDDPVLRIYFTLDRIAVVPTHRTQDGIYISAGPVRVLDRECSPEELGAEISASRADCRVDVAPPEDRHLASQPLLVAMQLRSWSALQSRAKLVKVDWNAPNITITPTRNGGVTGDDRCYHDLPHASSFLDLAATDRMLGETVQRALTRCQGAA